MEDYDRTMELVEASSNSLGATYAQQAVYTESLAFAQNRLNVAWEGFVTSLSNSDFIIGVIDIMASFVEGVTEAIETVEELPGPVKLLIGTMVALSTTVVVSGIALTKWKEALGEAGESVVKADKPLKNYIFGLIEATFATGTATTTTYTFSGAMSALGTTVSAALGKIKAAFVALANGHPILLGATVALTAFVAG